HHEEFLAAGARIVGVSRDSLRSHENFVAKQGLPFPLISDSDETLCQLFGVIKMKNMYGKQVRGIERSTFLISDEGVLLREWRGLRVPGHVEAVLQAVREQESASTASEKLEPRPCPYRNFPPAWVTGSRSKRTARPLSSPQT